MAGTKRKLTQNAQLATNAKEAIEALFADKTVAPEKARDNLEEIIDDCRMKIDSLDLD